MMSELIGFLLKLGLFCALLAYVGSCSYRKVIEDQISIKNMTERCK